MNCAPRFSVVVPTLNRAHLLPVAVRSVLAQREPDFELVIVDDGSTDATADVVRGFDDPRVRSFRHERAGVSAARNSGAAAARGEFLVFLDDDDELLPEALTRFSDAIAAHGFDVIVAGRIDVSADRATWTTTVPDPATVFVPHAGTFLPGAFCVRRSLFDAIGGYDVHLRFGENTELGWRLRAAAGERGGGMGIVDAPLVIRYAAGSGRGYDDAKYDAATRVLAQHRELFDGNPHFRSTYENVAAVSAARLGRRREAMQLGVRALLDDPTTPARYRALLSVARAMVGPPRSRNGVEPAPSAPAAAPVHAGSVHAVLVTFNRPGTLAETVRALATSGIASLTVIDNAPSEASTDAACSAQDAVPTTYIPMERNAGPAGALAVGMARVLATVPDDDWVLICNDDGLPGTDGSVGRLREFGAWLLAHGAPVGAVGLVGARYDARRGRLIRPHDEELAGPVTVDYVAGGQLLMLRACAARAVGVFDWRLFFGFEELDYCLRLRRAGYGIYVNGPDWYEERRKAGRLGPSVERAPRPINAWRRYYSVRNHIVVVRRFGSLASALAVTFVHFLARPAIDLVQRRRGWRALTAAGWRGCIDAWAGRLGRQVPPSDAPGEA